VAVVYFSRQASQLSVYQSYDYHVYIPNAYQTRTVSCSKTGLKSTTNRSDGVRLLTWCVLRRMRRSVCLAAVGRSAEDRSPIHRDRRRSDPRTASRSWCADDRTWWLSWSRAGETPPTPPCQTPTIYQPCSHISQQLVSPRSTTPTPTPIPKSSRRSSPGCRRKCRCRCRRRGMRALPHDDAMLAPYLLYRLIVMLSVRLSKISTQAERRAVPQL